MQSTRKPPNFYKKPQKVGIKQVSFKCADCSEISHNKKDLVEHMKNEHGKTIKFVSNQTIKKNLGVHNSAIDESGRQILTTKTVKVVGPPVTKVGKLKTRHHSRFFDCLAHPNLSATLATDQKLPF